MAAWFGVAVLILLVMIVFFVRAGAPVGGTRRRQAGSREHGWRGTVRRAQESTRQATDAGGEDADLQVGPDVRTRVGDEAVEAFARRVRPGGVCGECGLSFDGRQVGVSAYPMAGRADGAGQPVLLVASHAECRSSRWEDEPDAAAQAVAFTGEAAATVLTLRVRVPLRLPHRLQGMGRGWFADRTMPLLLGGPPREAMLVHVRPSGASATADADLYRALGFAALSETAGHPLPVVGLADLTDVLAFWPTLRVTVGEGEEVLAATVHPRLARLVRLRGGALVAVAGDLPLGSLGPGGVRDGLASGRLLVGWASLGAPRTRAPRIGDLGADSDDHEGFASYGEASSSRSRDHA